MLLPYPALLSFKFSMIKRSFFKGISFINCITLWCDNWHPCYSASVFNWEIILFLIWRQIDLSTVLTFKLFLLFFSPSTMGGQIYNPMCDSRVYFSKYLPRKGYCSLNPFWWVWVRQIFFENFRMNW